MAEQRTSTQRILPPRARWPYTFLPASTPRLRNHGAQHEATRVHYRCRRRQREPARPGSGAIDRPSTGHAPGYANAPGAEAPTALPRTQRTGPASPATGLIVANLRGRTGAGTGKDNTDVRLAVRVESGLLDVTVAARALGFSVPQTTDELIENGEGQLRACMAKAMAAPRADWLVAENAAAFAPCVSNPQKIVCIGLNYRRHAREIGMAEPKAPIPLNKFNNALTHHRATVPTQGLPGNHFDY